MYTRLSLLLLIVLLACSLPAHASLSVSAQTPPDPLHAPQAVTFDLDKLGMVMRDPWYDFGTFPGLPDRPNYAAQDRMGAALEELGVRWVRMEFQIEGSDAMSVTQVARNDYFINEVAPRHNLKVLGLLGFNLQRGQDTMRLMTDPIYDDGSAPDGYGGAVNDYMVTWLDRARMIADRYEGHVAAYQILNEHNRMSDHEAIDAEVAARLHTKFYRFFRHVDSAQPGDQSWRDGVQIISGGLHPAGTSQPGDPRYVSDREYLRQIYASDGFQSYYDTYGVFPIDGLGYHPYPEEIRRSLQSDLDLISIRLELMREVLEEPEVNDPDLPFWITEIGYNAGYARQTEAGQALFLAEVVPMLAERNDVAKIFWFKYEDFPPAEGPFAQKWGVVRIPFTLDSACLGGACYEPYGRPELRRLSFWTYRTLAGRGGATPEPPTELLLDAPRYMDAAASDTYTMTATVEQASVTTPMTMTWQIDGVQVRQHTITDTLTDTLAFTGNITGTYEVLVEASNAAGVVIAEHTIIVGSQFYIPLVMRPE